VSPVDDPELGAVQAALLAALSRASSAEEALALLRSVQLPDWAELWLANSDPRALETAIHLVQRWAESEGQEP
jgi:acetylornithine/succinyldiaminopimelate/putrescine aminotransferase